MLLLLLLLSDDWLVINPLIYEIWRAALSL